MRQIAATRRRDRLLQQIASCNIICAATELRSVARIQTGLNSCDISQWQNKRKQPCRSVSTLLRQVAARKFKSTSEGASIIFPWFLRKPFKMATEHVEQDQQPEQSEVSSPSEWNVTTSRMVIEFCKENRVLWDRNRKDYGKNSLQKWISLSFFSSWLPLSCPAFSFDVSIFFVI